MSQTQTYTYSARPQSINNNTTRNNRFHKYDKENNNNNNTQTQHNNNVPRYIANIMYDKRVVRGPTVKPHIYDKDNINQQSKPKPSRTQRIIKHVDHNSDSNNNVNDKSSNNINLSESQRIDDKHTMCGSQTDNPYDELDDSYMISSHSTQTESDYIDTNDNTVPIFATRHIGIEQGTQIEPDELFNFDIAVQSILSVLVGKTINQSLNEVHNEIEIQQLQQQQEYWSLQRNALINEAQRLEAITRRHHNEKQKQVQRAKEVAEEKRIEQEQQLANTLAQQQLNAQYDNIINQLNDDNQLPDLLQLYIQDTFIPSVVNNVVDTLNQYNTAQQLLDHMLHHAVELIENQYNVNIQSQIDEQNKLDDLNNTLIQQSLQQHQQQDDEYNRLQQKWSAEEEQEKQRLEAERIEKELAEQERLRNEEDDNDDNDNNSNSDDDDV